MSKNDMLEDHLIKIITLLQHIASNQSKSYDMLRDIDNHIFHQYEILKQIQKQTKSETAEEQEEIRKKIEELNRMIK